MEKSLTELKVQAKKLLKDSNNNVPSALKRLNKYFKPTMLDSMSIQLKHCQMVLAKELGFADWQQLQQVFTGKALKQDLDIGSLFYHPRCMVYINQWFSTYQEAKLLATKMQFILPYKTQFVVVDEPYLETIGIRETKLMTKVDNDLYASYPSDNWDMIALQILKRRRTS